MCVKLFQNDNNGNIKNDDPAWKIWFQRSRTEQEYSSRCQEQKHSGGNRCHHTGEKCGIKIQGLALIFTQYETRTWCILGFWIEEFIASRPTSDTALHTSPFTGKTVMPENCWIHPRSLFPPRPSGPGLQIWAGRMRLWKVRPSGLPATTHSQSAARSISDLRQEQTLFLESWKVKANLI